MNNYQWLLQMDGADRKAWFDAEHVEHQEQALDGDTEPESSNTDAVSERYATAFKWLDRLDYGKGGVIGGSLCDTPEQGEVVMPLESWREYLGAESENADSREKLETDVRRIADAYNMDTQRHGTERFAHELYYSIIHLLDRQAEITEEQTRCKWVTASAEEIAAWRSKAEKLKEQVYELTAERDKLQEQLRIGWEYECRLQAERDKFKEANDYHAAQYELASEDCDRLQARVDELKAERVKLRSQICKLEDDLVRTSDERDNWRANCEDWKKDCERYRSKFGKCLDYADAIHALMDEGMA